MSDAQVRYEDISDIRNSVRILQGSVAAVHSKTEQVSNQVSHVNKRVERVNQDLIVLSNEFRRWVKEQRNANNLQRAITEIIRIRQELEEKFGKHAEARIRLRGILDTAETGLLREFTIASCSEQIMLDTPKYWLAPTLVALAAWISNNKDLAQKAVAEALRRDAEKASLLFALVCRRAVPVMTPENEQLCNARIDACFKWLEYYFDTQDPHNMKESVIVLVDSWANNVFGTDKDKICESTFKKWMDQLNSDHKEGEPTLEEKQKSHWYHFYMNHCMSTAGQYNVLSSLSPEFPYADAYLQRINSAPVIQYHFDKIRSAPINKDDLINRLDEQLNALISEFDIEEEELRKEETHFLLLKKYEGDMQKTKLAELRLAKKKSSEVASFADRLEEAIRSDDPKYNAARKTAINEGLLGKYIQSAYHEYITDKKAEFPETVTIRANEWMGWSGRTRDGRNNDELKRSYADHMNMKRQEALNKIDESPLKTKLILAIVFGALGLLLGLLVNFFLLVVGVGLGLVFFVQRNKLKNQIEVQRSNIHNEYNRLIGWGSELIDAALAQWAEILVVVNTFAYNAEANEHLNLEVI